MGKNSEPYVFAKKELLEIIDNNWPELLKDYTTEDTMMLIHNVIDEEREKARKSGVMLGMTEVNGKIIVNPGIGVVTNGHNIVLVKKANAIMRFVQESLMEIDKNKEEMKAVLSDKSGFEIKELDVCLHRFEYWQYCRVYEKNSKHYIDKTY